MSDVKIKVIDSDKLIEAINKGSYDVNLSAVMALGAVTSAQSETCAYWDRESNFCALHRPSAQPEPAIPLSWIENHIAWLKSLDNSFSTLTAMQISTMVKKWKVKQNESEND